MSRTTTKREIPKPPIEAVLRELGAEDVPTGFGWVPMRCIQPELHNSGEDRTPSARVNHDPDEGGYTCHACGLKGDGVKLLQEVLGLTWKEAVRRAEALGGASTTSKSKPAKRRRASELLKRN